MLSSFFGMRSVAWWTLLVVLAQLVSGLRTTPGSPCENSCNPSNETLPSEIVCADIEYNNTEAGRVFEQCISCQLQSTFADDVARQSDVEWGLCMSFLVRFSNDSQLIAQTTFATPFHPACLSSPKKRPTYPTPVPSRARIWKHPSRFN